MVIEAWHVHKQAMHVVGCPACNTQRADVAQAMSDSEVLPASEPPSPKLVVRPGAARQGRTGGRQVPDCLRDLAISGLRLLGWRTLWLGVRILHTHPYCKHIPSTRACCTHRAHANDGSICMAWPGHCPRNHLGAAGSRSGSCPGQPARLVPKSSLPLMHQKSRRSRRSRRSRSLVMRGMTEPSQQNNVDCRLA